jgi:hypothetical protein
MKISLLIFITLQFLTGCDDIRTREGIDFRNETDFVVKISFTYDSNIKDSLIMKEKGSYAGFTLFTYDYNKNEMMDSTVLLNQIKKLKIFRTVNNDTIFVNPNKYIKYNCWQKYTNTDMRDRSNYYVLTVTSDMFE